MGWVLLLVTGIAALLLLWRFGKLERQPLELAGASMLLALAGYAWWGHPSLAGSPTEPSPAATRSTSTISAQEQNQFKQQGGALMLAEALMRAGATRQATEVYHDAIKASPKDADLWVALGNALVIHGGGMMNPAASHAFEQAAQLSPNHPGPPFFMGLALAQSGKLDEAGEVWRGLLARAPEGAEWVPDLKARLEQIGQMPVAKGAQAASGSN